MRILLVDDELGMIRAMSRLLEPEHEVVGASCGAMALEAVAAGRFDGALVDIHLTDMHGAELIAKLEREAPEMPLAVITGGMNAEEAARVEGVPILDKPFTAEALSAFLDQHFGAKK